MATDFLEPSKEYKAQAPYWRKVADITAGVDAMRKAEYLPRFPNESVANHEYRMQSARLTDVFSDVVESLASKPFSREVGIASSGDMPSIVEMIVDDADRAGNHLHVFAQDLFYGGIANGIEWVMVDYPPAPAGETLADERRANRRPYLISIRALDLLEVRSSIVDNREAIVYARINESDAETMRVRILQRDETRAWFEVWERASGEDWHMINEGEITLGEIPLVAFCTGRRRPGTWIVTTPMKRVADLQIEQFQQETNLKLAKENTAFPMFKAEGVVPPTDERGNPVPIPVGPSTVLYAPPDQEGRHGMWGVIEPSATSLKFLADERNKTEQQMRELGRQPLTAGTAGLTQVATAYASQRASSAIQAYVYNLKDCLEKAIRYAAQWLGLDIEPEIRIDTDFAINIGDDKAPELLWQMAQGEDAFISRQQFLAEMKRRGILMPEYDYDADMELILNNGGMPEEE